MAVDPNPPITRDLLRWYQHHARPLPWRTPPGDSAAPDPYRVWLAEVMLQQTTVATAIPRYRRFVQRFGDMAALAQAPLEDVLHEWAGLGYYARARNLHACARVIAQAGAMPATEAGLRLLPGVGAYTAAAVAAIAFGQPTVPLDANLLRVGARLFAVCEPAARARAPVRQALRRLVPADAPGDFAQALMDLGATICTPAKPRCPACPIADHCAGFRSGRPQAFPVPIPRLKRPHRTGTLWWIESGGQVALVRRAADGLLGGMLALPGTPWFDAAAPPLATQAPPGLAGRDSGVRIRHGFTHFTLELAVMVAQPAAPMPELAGDRLIWVPVDALPSAGLPSLYRKAVTAMLASRRASCFETA